MFRSIEALIGLGQRADRGETVKVQVANGTVMSQDPSVKRPSLKDLSAVRIPPNTTTR